MAGTKTPPKASTATGDRSERLKSALKENLRKRKAQARKRAAPKPDTDG